jgi:hypothetical protein
LLEHIQRFLFDQINPESDIAGADVVLSACPAYSGRVFIHHSASAVYYAPSDLSGIGGMHREIIRAVPSWRNGPPRKDCVFIQRDDTIQGFQGLHVAQVLHFLQFKFCDVSYPTALVQWFIPIDDEPCCDTGMWIVAPELDEHHNRITSIVHLDCVLRAAHLIPVYGANRLPRDVSFSNSLDAFQAYYVNKFADHNSHEISF